jgi:hypothetical protein
LTTCKNFAVFFLTKRVFFLVKKLTISHVE